MQTRRSTCGLARVLFCILLFCIGAYLSVLYLRGTWVPSSSDLFAAVGGMALTVACIVAPRFFQRFCDRRGHRVRTPLLRHTGRSVFAGAIWGAVTGLAASWLGPPFGHRALCYLAAACLAMVSACPRYWQTSEVSANPAASVAAVSADQTGRRQTSGVSGTEGTR